MTILTNYCQVVEPCAHCGSHEQMTERTETTVGTRYTTFCVFCGLAKASWTQTLTISVSNDSRYVLGKK